MYGSFSDLLGMKMFVPAPGDSRQSTAKLLGARHICAIKPSPRIVISAHGRRRRCVLRVCIELRRTVAPSDTHLLHATLNPSPPGLERRFFAVPSVGQHAQGAKRAGGECGVGVVQYEG